MLEFYQAYATYHDLMDLTEEMISSICRRRSTAPWRSPTRAREVNLTPPWKRLTMDEALVEVGGIDPAHPRR